MLNGFDSYTFLCVNTRLIRGRLVTGYGVRPWRLGRDLNLKDSRIVGERANRQFGVVSLRVIQGWSGLVPCGGGRGVKKGPGKLN